MVKSINFQKKIGISAAEIVISILAIFVLTFLVVPTCTDMIKNSVFNSQKKQFQLSVRAALYSMMVDGELNNHYETKDFVQRLQYYIPVSNICTSKELVSCFPKFFTDGARTYKTEDLVTTSKLGLKWDYEEEVYGIVFQNGVSALVAYKSDCTIPKRSLQTSVMDCMTMIYDINSINKPNKTNKDIGGINAGGKIKGNTTQVGTVKLR